MRGLALICLLVAACFPVTPAQARRWLPSGALATIAYPNGHEFTEYGTADLCETCTPAGLYDWASPAPYDVAPAADGHLLIAHVDGSNLRVDSYDPASYRLTGRHSAAFPGWKIGDVLLADDGNVYVLLGRSNPRESTGRIVIVVRKLDRNLASSASAAVSGGFDAQGIYEPFEDTDSSMALEGGTLVVHTARLIFHVPGDSAPHHQVNLTFAVDTATMMARSVLAPYASHSFRQFVRPHGLDGVFLDQGDAYPRALQIGVVNELFAPPSAPQCNTSDTVGDCPTDPTTFNALWFPGKLGDNYTGATVNGFEVGPTNALTVGLSVPNDNPVNGISGRSDRFVRNVYAISSDLVNETSSFSWLTTLTPTARRTLVGQPKLVRLSDNSFAVLFTTEVRGRQTLSYVLLDQYGTVITRKSWAGREFAALGQPAILGTKLLWVGFWSGIRGPFYRTGDFLYGLDVSNPTSPSLLRRPASTGRP